MLFITFLRILTFRRLLSMYRFQTFEKFVSEFRKDKTKVLVLHEILRMLEDEDARISQYGRKIDTESYFATALLCAKNVQRSLAVAPDAMSHVLAEKTFTSNADIQVVEEIYKKTFGIVVGQAKELKFESMDWITTEIWLTFAMGVIPLCMRLESLNLSYNGNLVVDIVELVAKLPPSLKELDLDSTGCVGDAGKADWARLEVLEDVDLDATKVTGDIVELVAKLPSTLKELSLMHTGFEGDGTKAEWKRLPVLEDLFLRDTKVTGAEYKLRKAGCTAEDIVVTTVKHAVK